MFQEACTVYRESADLRVVIISRLYRLHSLCHHLLGGLQVLLLSLQHHSGPCWLLLLDKVECKLACFWNRAPLANNAHAQLPVVTQKSASLWKHQQIRTCQCECMTALQGRTDYCRCITTRHHSDTVCLQPVESICCCCAWIRKVLDSYESGTLTQQCNLGKQPSTDLYCC